MTVEVSKLWKSLCADVFANTDGTFLQTFRRPGGSNNRLAAWDPLDRSMRYFKFLLYTTAQRQPERFFTLYQKLGKVDFGQPIAVTLHSCDINIDYFLSIEEFLFLEAAMDFGSVRSIVEIGAGFGRTCHSLLALSAAECVEEYSIVDLPEVLQLSRRVLEKVIPLHYHKVRFIDATDETNWKGLKADLAINIDSFQEMLPATIDAYMELLISNTRFFYLKNPIGKYDPVNVGLPALDHQKLQDVFSLGYCQDVIDIFSDAALENARPRYLKAYLPASDWRVIADRPMELFPYYHHALYSRK